MPQAGEKSNSQPVYLYSGAIFSNALWWFLLVAVAGAPRSPFSLPFDTGGDGDLFNSQLMSYAALFYAFL